MKKTNIQKLITLLITFFVMSCQYGVKITINNKSNTQIDSIILATDFEKFKLDKFKINKSHTFYINFKNSKHKGDGIFILNSYNGNKLISESFGYYSNGVPPNKNFVIDLSSDKIIVNRIEQ